MAEASTFTTGQAAAPAVSQPVAQGDTSSGSVVSDSELLYTYEDEQKRPYTADYFEVPSVWDKEPALKRDLQEIEGYIRSQVTDGKLDNSTKAADLFLKELERKAGLTRYEAAPQRIQKLLAYIDFRKVVDS